MIRGTRSEDIINVLNRIALSKRLEVVEVSLDMASNMRKACEMAFSNASLGVTSYLWGEGRLRYL